MRGKDVLANLVDCRAGITPAHAGKSLLDFAEGVLSEDHPRACGEKDLDKAERIEFIGSPPRMRGKEPPA